MGCMLALVSSAYADNHHVHPQDNKTVETAAPLLKANYAGYCEIEIINQSYDDVRVNGTFDDGTPLQPFTIYSYEAPHYISLFFYGYCHYGMNLYIDSYYGYNLYSGYTTRESTVRIVPYLRQNATADVDAKANVKTKVEVTKR
jgi:hypothetical protein